jgi:hypothetical protein
MLGGDRIHTRIIGDKMPKFMELITGKPAKIKRVSPLTPEQERLKAQQIGAAQGRGAGGAFGESSDYYRDILNDENETINQLNAPEIRRFNEEIIPDLAEQFAGMGAGGLTSSGFRNAAVNAGTDLSERLGAIRARLRHEAAQGLQRSGSEAVSPYMETLREEPTEGLIDYVTPLAGQAISAFGGPVLGATANAVSNWLTGETKKGSTSPYHSANSANTAINTGYRR